MIRNILIFCFFAGATLWIILTHSGPNPHISSTPPLAQFAARSDQAMAHGFAPDATAQRALQAQMQSQTVPVGQLAHLVKRSVMHRDEYKQSQSASRADVPNPFRNYHVTSGDTLPLIAVKLYGSALATDQVLRDNPFLLKKGATLRIGQVLKYRAD